MTYLIIDPLGNSSGISAYTETLKKNLDSINVKELKNTKKMCPEKFRIFVRDEIINNYGTEEVIIEAPEAKASTLLIPRYYNVHIRLHCPLAIAQKYDNQDVNQVELSNELRVINKAKIVSSPSYGLLKELEDEIDTENVFVYKNSDLFRNEYVSKNKKYDIVFMGRMQTLKGIDYIRKIIELLPKEYNILIFGNNIERLKLGTNYKCNVELRHQIESNLKFKLIGESKVLMQLSKFENCSMVILESLSVGTPVVCWNVGGNPEISENNSVISVTKFDIYEMVHNIRNIIENYDQRDLVTKCKETLKNVNADFKNGITNIIEYLNNSNKNVYKGINNSSKSLLNVLRTENTDAQLIMPKRVLGIAYSNEHFEELWNPILKQLGLDYRYISRRPIGYRKLFNIDIEKVEDKYLSVFDWIKYQDRMIQIIKNYKPNIILFHNGDHPSYQSVLAEIKKLKIPIIYTELGWFPQKNHIYFDTLGVNGKSLLARLNFEEFVKKPFIEKKNNEKVNGDYHLIITQLENDTNMIVNSKRFKTSKNFLKYVIDQLPKDDKVIIRQHPLDDRFLDLSYKENVTFVDNGPIEVLLENAKTVIGINSTVLLQALEYKQTNIYYCGDSILDNKKVAQKFDKNDLSQLINNDLFCSDINKINLVKRLKDYQVNIEYISSLNASNIQNHIGLRPLLEVERSDFSHLIIKEKANSNNEMIVKKNYKMIPRNIRHLVPRKLREKYIIFLK